MHINRWLILLVLLPIFNWAQGDFKPCENEEEWISKIVAHQQQTVSLKASYVEWKDVKGFKEPQKGTGLFYFRQKESIRLEQKTPQDLIFLASGKDYHLRINGKDESKSQQMMIFKQLHKMIIAMLDGSILEEKDKFSSKVYSNEKQIMIALFPEDRKFKSYVSEIILKFEKTSLNLVSFLTIQQTGSKSELIFEEVQENIKLEDQLFLNF